MSAEKETARADSATNNVVRLHKSTKDYVQRLFERATQRKRFLIPVEARLKATVPLVGAKVQAGFPSPADDYLDRPLCFNELLMKNPPATFVAWVDGDSMIGAGIFPGDLAVIDRSMAIKDGVIILARVDLDFTLKRFRQRKGRAWLQAENPTYNDVEIKEGMSFDVWGGLRFSIRMFSQ